MPGPSGLRSKILVCRVAFLDGFDIAEEHLRLNQVEDIFSGDDEEEWQGPKVQINALQRLVVMICVTTKSYYGMLALTLLVADHCFCLCTQAVMQNGMAHTMSRFRMHSQVTQAPYSQAQAVRRSLKKITALPSSGDTSRSLDSLYVVFNHHLVLPEYIVEYELVCFMGCALTGGRQAAQCC